MYVVQFWKTPKKIWLIYVHCTSFMFGNLYQPATFFVPIGKKSVIRLSFDYHSVHILFLLQKRWSFCKQKRENWLLRFMNSLNVSFRRINTCYCRVPPFDVFRVHCNYTGEYTLNQYLHYAACRWKTSKQQKNGILLHHHCILHVYSDSIKGSNKNKEKRSMNL